MPLAFESLNHKTVAFGFYNIETDGLLLDRLFFFSTDFCRAVEPLLSATGPAEAVIPGHRFDDPAAIGDLMGAIGGVSRAGYLGELYSLWPFPARPVEFRQHGRGHQNRQTTEEILSRHGRPQTVTIARTAAPVTWSVGGYLFSAEGFTRLLAYVWRGGYPTWDERPAYVPGSFAPPGPAGISGS